MKAKLDIPGLVHHVNKPPRSGNTQEIKYTPTTPTVIINSFKYEWTPAMKNNTKPVF